MTVTLKQSGKSGKEFQIQKRFVYSVIFFFPISKLRKGFCGYEITKSKTKHLHVVITAGHPVSTRVFDMAADLAGM